MGDCAGRFNPGHCHADPTNAAIVLEALEKRWRDARATSTAAAAAAPVSAPPHSATAEHKEGAAVPAWSAVLFAGHHYYADNRREAPTALRRFFLQRRRRRWKQRRQRWRLVPCPRRGDCPRRPQPGRNDEQLVSKRAHVAINTRDPTQPSTPPHPTTDYRI